MAYTTNYWLRVIEDYRLIFATVALALHKKVGRNKSLGNTTQSQWLKKIIKIILQLQFGGWGPANQRF